MSDPMRKIGVGVIDHGRHHAVEAQKQSHLHGDENDREDDADDGRDKSKPVVKQVPACELENQGHNAFDRPGSVRG
jgi:hypothetical protein